MDKPAESTALTVLQRAALALHSAEHEKKLKELVVAAKEINAITNADSYKQLHATRMSLKNERVQLTKEGKEAREDAAKFAKAVIAEEARLIAIIEPDEKRLEGIQREFDERLERERQAKAEAEQRRIEQIRAAIAEIIAVGSRFTAQSGSVVIEAAMQQLLAEPVTAEDYHELVGDAHSAKAAAMVKLGALHSEALAHEAEQRRIIADRAELARLQEEKAQRDAETAAREAAHREAHERVERDARERVERELAEGRARIAEEERVAKARRDEEDRAAREQRAREQHAQMLTSELQGIQQQVIIAQIGRAGVRTGGTLKCLEDTLIETKDWPIDAAHWGNLVGVAQATKDQAIASIQKLLAEAEEREAQRHQQEVFEEAQRERDKKAREEEAREEAARQAQARAVLLEEARHADAETLLRTFVERYSDIKRFKPVVKVITTLLDPRKAPRVVNG